MPDEFKEVRAIFLEPEVSDEYALSWRKTDPEAVRRILCDKHGFSVDRVDTVLARIVSKDDVRKQKSLDSFAE